MALVYPGGMKSSLCVLYLLDGNNDGTRVSVHISFDIPEEAVPRIEFPHFSMSPSHLKKETPPVCDLRMDLTL